MDFLDSRDPRFASLQLLQREGDISKVLDSLASYFRNKTTPRYFFRPGDVRKRIKEFEAAYSTESRSQVSRANEFMEQYGADVDWKQPGHDRFGAKHTPNTIRYLARQWEAENLARAFFISGDDQRYSDFLFDHIGDFVSDFENGKTETGGNDIFERFYAGHRARNWLSAYFFLRASGTLTTDRHLLMVKVFLLHGAKLIDQAQKFNYGNHQLVGLTGVFEISTMFPEFPVMRKWNRKALNMILEHMDKEIAEDGFQFERSSHYHKLDIINYFRVLQLCRLNGLSLPPWYEKKFRRMFQAMAELCLPTRALPVLQDVTDPAGHNEDTVRDEMSLGAILFKDPVYKYFGDEKLPPSLFWYFNEGEITAYQTMAPVTPGYGSLALPQTGYYVMRSGWAAQDLYLLIDGGRSKEKPDHSHGGVLGLIGYGRGNQFLPNYTVSYRDSAYPILKNSLVKTVAMVDSMPQGKEWIANRAGTGFGRWGKLANPNVIHWWTGEAFDKLTASHDGFKDVGVVYNRTVLFVKPLFWIVWDTFEASGHHSYQQIWQGEYQAYAQLGRAVQNTGNSDLILQQIPEGPWAIKKKTFAGKESVWFAKESEGIQRYCTLVIPATREEGKPDLVITQRGGGAMLNTVRVDGGMCRFITAESSQWSIGGFSSDARFFAETSTSPNHVSLLVDNGTKLTSSAFVLSSDSVMTGECLKVNDTRWRITLLRGGKRRLSVSSAGTSMQVRMETGETVDIDFSNPGG